MAERYLKYAYLINSHTHIGDFFIKLPSGNFTLDEIVAPVYGYKHRMLENAGKEDIVNGMRRALKIMANSGTTAFVDFREGGIEGIEMLREALNGEKIKAIILGRPKKMKYDADEIDKILSISHGIGLSSISDWNDDIEKIAEHVHRKRKIFAMHASEGRREDIDRILSLKPDLLIHLCMADEKDIEKVGEENIPVVVCPRANAFFGLRPKIELMAEHGITLMLGTDNAMIAEPDIRKEMEYTLENFDVSEEMLIKMVWHNPKKIFKEFLMV